MLDDTRVMRKADRHDMLGAISGRPEQIRESFRIVERAGIDKFFPNRVAVCGMGWSAVPADLLDAWLLEKHPLHLAIWRNYGLPKTYGRDTLVIAISYSGNTEETISAAEAALSHGCRLVGISSGGRLAQLCKDEGVPLFKVPKGLQPRAAVGYLFAIQSLVLERLGLCEIGDELKECAAVLEKIRPRLVPEKKTSQNNAKRIALTVNGTTPAIYGSGVLAPVARCWKAHFNENSKILAWAGELPEMNHNEIVGWDGDGRRTGYTAILLRDRKEHKRVSRRMELTKDIAFGGVGRIIEVWGDGKSDVARMFSTLWVGEFASVYLALLRNTDPSSVEAIDNLKKQMKMN